jgi:hypothetical protein
MSKIVELKELDDSVDTSTSMFEMVRADNTSLRWGGREMLLSHPLAVEIPTQGFQNIHDRTNDNNIYFHLNLIANQNYYLALMNKRGKREISSFRLNDYVDNVNFQTLHKESAPTWTVNIAEAKIMPKIQHGSRSIVNRLKEFATLEKGWDSYGANPIEWFTITRAIEFFFRVLCVLDSDDKNVVPIPFIAPRSDGGIQFEWSTCYKELIHSIPDEKEKPIEYLKVDSVSGEEKEEEGEVSSIDDIVDIVTEWLL